MTLGNRTLGNLEGERFADILVDAANRAARGSKTFYVDSSTGASGNSGERLNSPLATLAQAYAKCTSGNGDQIILLPDHAETVTSVLTVSKTNLTIKGISRGNKIPVITGNGTIDVISLEAAGCSVENIKFAAPSTDAQTADINIAAANCLIKNTVHIGSTTSKNKADIITLTADADDVLIDGVYIYNTVVECVGGIVFEGALTNAEVRNCFVFDSIGFTDGCISDEATATGLYIHHNTFANAKADTVVMEFGNNSTGVCAYNNINGRHTTIASNVTPGTGMAFFQNFAVEEAAKNGIVIPVADAE
jgi:hypothetical protein